MTGSSRSRLDRKLSSAFRAFTSALDPYATPSYSQEGEDMVLRRMFEGVESATLVEILDRHLPANQTVARVRAMPPSRRRQSAPRRYGLQPFV